MYLFQLFGGIKFLDISSNGINGHVEHIGQIGQNYPIVQVNFGQYELMSFRLVHIANIKYNHAIKNSIFY